VLKRWHKTNVRNIDRNTRPIISNLEHGHTLGQRTARNLLDKRRDLPGTVRDCIQGQLDGERVVPVQLDAKWADFANWLEHGVRSGELTEGAQLIGAKAFAKAFKTTDYIALDLYRSLEARGVLRIGSRGGGQGTYVRYGVDRDSYSEEFKASIRSGGTDPRLGGGAPFPLQSVLAGEPVAADAPTQGGRDLIFADWLSQTGPAHVGETVHYTYSIEAARQQSVHRSPRRDGIRGRHSRDSPTAAAGPAHQGQSRPAAQR
jgi:hypothetical protein